MIEKSRERGVYDRLEVGDLVEAMKKRPASFDLLVAADVFIYVGDLAPTFEAAAACLRPGGLLAFSVEAGGGDRFNLTMATRRYTHSEPYLRRMAAMYGFEQVSLAPTALRVERGQAGAGIPDRAAVAGRIISLKRCSPTKGTKGHEEKKKEKIGGTGRRTCRFLHTAAGSFRAPSCPSWAISGSETSRRGFMAHD